MNQPGNINPAIVSASLFGLGILVGAFLDAVIHGFLLADSRDERQRPPFKAPPLQEAFVLSIATGILFALTYWWEVGQQGLLAAGLVEPRSTTLWRAAIHLLLLTGMLAATVVDLKERSIPDAITVPGTLLALILAALSPTALLPIAGPLPPNADFLRLSSPAPLPIDLLGRPHTMGLLIGLACYLGWCVALLPRVWRTGRGYQTALRIFGKHLSRDPSTLRIALLAVVGSAFVVAVWWQAGQGWEALLTSLVGLAFSGGLVWMVRIIGTAVLNREAMGFGDVTLLGMIGAFLGWQAGLIIFFLAPFFALLVGIAQWVVRRDPEIPYGPFLCMATVAVVARWATLWQNVSPIFEMGWLVPATVAVCLFLLGVLLALWRVIVAVFAGSESHR